AVPPDTKLSKLDVLVLATAYICHLTNILQRSAHVTKLCQNSVDDYPNLVDLKHNPQKTPNISRCGLAFPRQKIFATKKTTDLTAASKKWQNCGALRFGGLDIAASSTKTFENKVKFEKHLSHRTSSSIRAEKGTQPSLAGHAAPTPDCGCSYNDVYRNEMVPNIAGYSAGLSSKMAASLHPVKKWPMRSRLYDSILDNTATTLTASSKSCLLG
ncbi:transcription factor 23, partial [Elysia marginata]